MTGAVKPLKGNPNAGEVLAIEEGYLTSNIMNPLTTSTEVDCNVARVDVPQTAQSYGRYSILKYTMDYNGNGFGSPGSAQCEFIRTTKVRGEGGGGAICSNLIGGSCARLRSSDAARKLARATARRPPDRHVFERHVRRGVVSERELCCDVPAREPRRQVHVLVLRAPAGPVQRRGRARWRCRRRRRHGHCGRPTCVASARVLRVRR